MRLGKGRQAKLLAVFLLLSASAGGQSGKSFKYRLNDNLQKSDVSKNDNSLTINYSITDLNIESLINENGSFYRINIPGHTSSSIAGKPELPVLSHIITVPDNYSYQIKITDVKSTKIKPSGKKFEGVLYPAQESETKKIQKEKPAFIIDKSVYGIKGLIPADTVVIEPLGTMRNKKLSNLIISPVRYNPRSNILEIITSMKIEIIFFPQGSSPTKSATSESQVFSESLAKGVLNYDQDDFITGYSDKPVRMIILTDTAYLKHLQPFFRWKTQKGFKLEIITRGALYAGTTDAELKNTLSNIYNASSDENPPPEYLLIIGDVNKIPYYGTGNITDMYYGEFDGDGDYIPEMFIGRIPAKDTTELKSVITKLIQYEKYEFADTNHFQANALISAGYDNNYASIMNGQVRYIVENYMTASNNITEKHFYHPTSLTAKDSIIKIINKGTSFINYTGHGDESGWLHLDLKVADTSLLRNRNMYPFIISNACRTSQFNLPSAFGNNMLLANKKGAIGFIGCSNDSYWDEDLYWATGLGTTTADPTYETTGLGTFDRLFHTHNEPASDWYMSMGQVVYAGNLAVSAGTSSRKKYYWETYNLVGDPSIIPIIGQPESFSVSIPDTLPNGIKSLTLNIDPFAYIAISHQDTLWDASFVSPSGAVTLNMPGLSNDSCLLVITGQNKIPVIKTIYFSVVNHEFLNLTSTAVNDYSGNSNGKADFGETISLSLTISNHGLSDAEGVYARLTSTSQWAIINNDSLYIGSVKAISDTTISEGFNITIMDLVPDKGIITFVLDLKDSIAEKSYTFDLSVHSPMLEIVSFRIDDSMTGNNDFIADPGETVNLVFQIINRGSSSTSGNMNILSLDESLTLLETSVKSGTLEFGETTEIIVPAKFTNNADIGHLINIISTLDCAPHIISKDFSFRIGKVRESFESSSFRVFPWINVSPTPWIITGSNSYEGIISARSGPIGDAASSTLRIRTIFSSPDSVRFVYRVSSEPNWDYFSFLLNGKEIFRKSGEAGWEKKVFPVAAGINDMEWIYKKDKSINNGSDAAWIDLIDFSVSGSLRYIQKDLETVEIISPTQKDKLGRELISVKVINVGHDTIKGFNLGYSVNNKPSLTQYFGNVLIPYKDTVTVTFTSRADLSKYGLYDLKVFSHGNNDDYTGNDSLNISLTNMSVDEPILVFPNPFTDELKIIINSKVTDDAVISLINNSGKILYSINKKIINGENAITIPDIGLSPGIYYLDIRSFSIKKSIPVVKVKK